MYEHHIGYEVTRENIIQFHDNLDYFNYPKLIENNNQPQNFTQYSNTYLEDDIEPKDTGIIKK